MLHAGNVVTMFDNHCCGVNKRGQFIIPKSPSRGLVLKLDLTHFKASKAAQYTLGPHFLVLFQGNTEQLSNGNVVLGWGSTAQFSEFNGAGNRQLLQAKFPGIDQTYRATLQHWIGLPAAHPGGAVRTKGGRATVYASWNGTTQTKKWRVLAGSSSTHLSRVATKAMSNFETAIKLSKTHKVYEVEALDGKGHVLGRSKPFS
jgi:hypothetical protein